MDFFLYAVISTIYIMIIHFALAIKNEFNIFLMAFYFALGGIIGWWMGSYETGFIISIITSLLFW